MNHHIYSQNQNGLKIVAIGGGNGLSTVLTGLKEYVGGSYAKVSDLSAIVAVTDDGGSSGRLRDELQMLPPGDIRNCMVALSEDSTLLSRLFRHRFSGEGDLGGHSFGNLFLAALSEVTGDFTEAVRLSSEILASKGRIFPATDADVRLVAELLDGSIVYGESKIGLSGKEIKKLRLDPEECSPLPDAVAAVAEADVITIGPGSLFTSILPPLLVKGMAEAINSSKAVKMYISNLMTQPGETDGLSAIEHINKIRAHVPQFTFDQVIVNTSPISKEQLGKYHEQGAEQIGLKGSISPHVLGDVNVIYGNLLDSGEKVRHDHKRLAETILLAGRKIEKANTN